MSTTQLERFTIVEFRDLPDGACFVNPLMNDRQLSQLPLQLDRARHYVSTHVLLGHYIKVDRYGFRDGSQGEGALLYRKEKQVIYGNMIRSEASSARHPREILMLQRLFALPPLEITMDLILASRTFGSAKQWAETVRTDLAQLIQQELIYKCQDRYRLTGDGVRRALRSNFTPYRSDQ